MEYALPYFLLTIFLAVMANARHFAKDELARLYIDMACVAVFLFFFGLRGFVNYDWMSYYPRFMRMPSLGALLSEPFYKWDFEPGFTLFMWACHAATHSWQFFVFMVTAIDVALLMRFFRKFGISLPLGLMMFLAMNGTGMMIDTFRNTIAILLFCNAIPYIIERKPLPYFAICLVAVSFHYSALVYLPLYFFIHRRINKWVLLGLFLVACVVYLRHISVVKPILGFFAGFFSRTAKQYLDTYQSYDVNGSILSIGFIERFFTGVITFLYIDKLRAQRKGNDVFVNSLYIYIFLFLFLSEFRTMGNRSAMLFTYGYWVVWIYLIRCFYFTNNRNLYIGFLVVYCLLKSWNLNCHAINKYENVLFPHMTYNERAIYFEHHFE